MYMYIKLYIWFDIYYMIFTLFTMCEPVFANTFFLHHAQTPLSELFLQGLQSLVEAQLSQINIANKRPATHNCLKKFKFPNLSSNIFRMLLTVFSYSFPSPPLPFFWWFWKSPAWTAASGLANVNSESFCIKRPPSWSRVSMVDWVPCKCLGFWGQVFTKCGWFWSDWCEEYEKKPGITVTKTWGKGWGDGV